MSLIQRAIRNKAILEWIDGPIHRQKLYEIFTQEHGMPAEEVSADIPEGFIEDPVFLDWLWVRFNWNICSSRIGMQYKLDYLTAK